jgi:hypothetical protein
MRHGLQCHTVVAGHTRCHLHVQTVCPLPRHHLLQRSAVRHALLPLKSATSFRRRPVSIGRITSCSSEGHCSSSGNGITQRSSRDRSDRRDAWWVDCLRTMAAGTLLLSVAALGSAAPAHAKSRYARNFCFGHTRRFNSAGLRSKHLFTCCIQGKRGQTPSRVHGNRKDKCV